MWHRKRWGVDRRTDRTSEQAERTAGKFTASGMQNLEDAADAVRARAARRPGRPLRLAYAGMAALLAIGLLAGCGKGKSESDKDAIPGAGEGEVVATYDGGTVTQVEFDKYVGMNQIADPTMAFYLSIPEFKEQFLRQYVLSKVLIERATDAQWKTAREEAGRMRADLEQGIKDQPELKEELNKRNLTVDEMVKLYERMIVVRELIAAKQAELAETVTEDELRAEFEKAPDAFDTASVRHVLIATVDSQTGEEKRSEEEALKLAREVKEKLENGADWNEIARQYSDDPGSKENGGLYENYKTNQWVEGFKNAVNTQPIGAIGDPVKTEYGYHVIKVESRTKKTFDTLTEEDRTSLRDQVVYAKLDDYLRAEQDKLGISVSLPKEEPEASPSADPETSPEASPGSSPESSPKSSPESSPKSSPSASSATE
jgi:foldase protein PrsA